MAENRKTDQPADAAVPQVRPASDAADRAAAPRKRAPRAAKATAAKKATAAEAQAPAAKKAARKPAKAAKAVVASPGDPIPTEMPSGNAEVAGTSAEASGTSAEVAATNVDAPTEQVDAPDQVEPPAKKARKTAQQPRDAARKTAMSASPTTPDLPAIPVEDAPLPATPAAPDSRAPDSRAPDRAEPGSKEMARELPMVPPGAWASAAWEAARHLDEPPERLAELAVADLGPRAAAWVRWLRETYPGAPAAGIARLAARQATRSGWLLTGLGAGGPLLAAAHLSATAWVRATLVLRIAAAYGHDPTDPRRATELLELLNLVPDKGQGGSQLWGVAAYALSRLRRRRRTPFGAATRVLYAASEQGDGLERLAHRAIRRYRAG